MNKDEIVAFKNEVRNYRFYKNKISHYKELIDQCYYCLSGKKGISYDKQSVTPNPELTSEQKYRVYDEINRYELKIATLQGKIDSIDRILEQCKPSIKSAIIEIYADNQGYAKVGYSRNYSTTGIFKAINSNLKKIKSE